MKGGSSLAFKRGLDAGEPNWQELTHGFTSETPEVREAGRNTALLGPSCSPTEVIQVFTRKVSLSVTE